LHNKLLVYVYIQHTELLKYYGEWINVNMLLSLAWTASSEEDITLLERYYFKGEKRMKTLLILVDGMRPDAIENMPAVQELMKKSTYTLDARTVMPSVTLPCHVSLFHSVDPERHGTTTNVYAPQVRPIKGLCEVLSDHGKKNAFFYDWEQLRDLTRPGSLTFSYFF